MAIYYCEASLSTKELVSTDYCGILASFNRSLNSPAQFIGVSCIVIGTCLLFASHRYFKTSLFTFTFLTFTVISYIFLEVDASVYIKLETSWISMMFGAISKFAVQC